MIRFSKWLKKYFIPHEGNDFKPHFLRHETMLAVFFLIVIVELGFLVQVFIVFDKTKFLAQVLPAVLEDLTNQERAQNNVAPLTESPLLDKAAQEKADDMAKNGYFAHTSPEGKTPWYWFDQVGYHYIYAGENLAVNFFESNDVAQAWMNSPTHRQNIVKKEYTQIGIGVANGEYEGRSTVFVAQLFGTPLVFPTEPAKTPEPTNTAVNTAPKTETAPVAAPVPKKTPAPKTTPTPKPVTTNPKPVEEPVVVPASTPVSTTSVTIPIPTPTATKVLGEESTTSLPVVAQDQAPVQTQSPLKSFLQKALAAPRSSITYLYEILGLLILLILVFVFVKSEIHHKASMARGFAMIAVILVLSYINLHLLNIKTQVPTDDHNFSANVVNAFP